MLVKFICSLTLLLIAGCSDRRAIEVDLKELVDPDEAGDVFNERMEGGIWLHVEKYTNKRIKTKGYLIKGNFGIRLVQNKGDVSSSPHLYIAEPEELDSKHSSLYNAKICFDGEVQIDGFLKKDRDRFLKFSKIYEIRNLPERTICFEG